MKIFKQQIILSTIFFSLLACIMLISCEQIIDRLIYQDTRENFTSQWRGTWKGTYSGSKSGNITIKVYKKGHVDVILTGGLNGDFFYGIVYNGTGALQSSINNSNKFKLYGNLLQQHGTWKKGELEGE